MKRMVVLLAMVVACKGKSKDPPTPGAASAAQVADAAQAVDAAPPIDAAPALPSSSTRNGPWGLDAAKQLTLADIAAAGYTTKDDMSTSRNGYDKAGFVGRGGVAGVAAHYASEGADKSITFYETAVAEESPADSFDDFEKAGLCVEGICPGTPLALAAKLNIKTCMQYTVEMNWFYGCRVEGSPLVIVASSEGPTAAKPEAHETPIAFKKLVARKLVIDALAWGAWQPMGGCTTDCD